MTLATTSSTSGPYACNGATTVFAYGWKILDDDEIEVTLINSAGVRTVLTKTTHYSVSGVGVAGGGNVTTVATYAAGNSIYLRRKPPLTQTSAFQNQGAYAAASHEEAFDKLAMQVQYLRDESNRAFKVSVGADSPDPIGTYDDLIADAAAAIAEEAVDLVTAEGTEQVGLVEAAGTAQVAAVNSAGSTQVTTVNSAGSAQLALIAAAGGATMYADTSDALSSGVVGTTSLVGGSGGTNGTFALGFSGGGGSGAAGVFTVAGGALTSIVITAPGVNYTSAPTLSFAASSGLTGASATAQIGVLTSVGEYFQTPGTDGAAFNVYRVDAGPVATLVGVVYASDAADPQTLHQARRREDYQTASGDRDYPALEAVRPYAWTFTGGGVRNADNTVDLPTGATEVSPNLDFPPFSIAGNRYCYVVLTEEISDALEIKIHQAGTVVKAGNTVTQPSPGVYRQEWNNSAPLSYVTITVTNVSGGTVTAFVPEVYQTDSAYLPQVLSHSDVTLVPENRRVIDWDEIGPYARWQAMADARRAMTEADITNAFDSVGGSDAAAGTRYAPKQTFAAGSALAQDAVAGFKTGSVWRESFNHLGSSTKGLRMRAYSDGRVGKDLPVIKGCKSLTGATWTLESGSCWYTDVTVDAACVANDGYSYMKVIETATASATASPLGATRMLTKASSKANCIATTGSYFVEETSSTGRRVYVNPNDATIPSSSTTYTYEVTDRYCVVNWQAGNARMGVMEGIEVYDSCFGYGAISGGPQSLFRGVIASHGGTHTLKMEAGSVEDFLIYNRGNANSSTANCYLSPNADGYSWRWAWGMAYACYPSAVYSHNAAGTYDSGEYIGFWVDGERQSNGALIMGDAFVCDSVSEVLVEWCYARGFQRQGRAGNATIPVNATMRNCLFRELGIFYSHRLTQNCIVTVENQSDPSSVNNRNSIMCRLSENHIVEKCLVHAKNTDVSGYAAALTDYSTTVIDIVQTGASTPNARKNIFLVETHLASLQNIVQETGAAAWASDYNVFIFCVAGHIDSYKSGGSTKHTVAEYLSVFTGHDANSLFVDLRDDPRGAQAVFRDPDNGDYRWADTEVARAIKEYCIANDCGPDWTIDHWPTMPTVDEARAALIRAYAA